MSWGRAEQSCDSFKNWPANPGLCGRCAWRIEDHKEMKNMQPHQQRVVVEKNELDDKLTKLSQFIDGSSTFKSLSVQERERLMQQRDVMGSYSKILGDRIAAF